MEDPNGDGYKHLRILELDNILHTVMKYKLTTVDIKRFKLLLKSKLHTRNLMTTINIWVFAVALPS